MAFKVYQEEPFSFQKYMAQPREVNTTEAMVNSFNEATSDAGTTLAARYMAMKELEERGGSPLTPEEANSLYPDMPVPFREPVKPTVARFLYDQHMEKVDMARKQAMAPDSVGAKLGTFGAGMIAHLMDPLELAVTAATGWGVGKAAAMGVFGERVAGAVGATELAAADKTLKVATKSMLLKEGVESVAGNVIQNTALEAASTAQNSAEHEDSAFSFGNVAIGTIVGTGFHMGIKGFSRILKDRYRSLSPGLEEKVANTTINQLESGTVVNPEMVVEAVAKETDVPADKAPVNYKYEPLTSPREKVFYGSTEGRTGDNIFGGEDLTDNPMVANATATRSFSDVTGNVYEAHIDSDRMLNIDKPLPESLWESIKAPLEKAGFTKEYADSFSAKDILSTVMDLYREQKLDLNDVISLKEALREHYDAMVHDGSTRAGVEHSPHNSIEILNEDALRKGNERTPDPLVKRTPTVEEIEAARKYMEDPKNKVNSGVDEYIAAEKETRNIDLDVEAKKIEKAVMDHMEKVQSLMDQGHLESIQASEIRDFSEAKSKSAMQDTLRKALANCMTKGA